MNENIPTPKEFQVDDLRYKTLTDTEVCVVGLAHPQQDVRKRAIGYRHALWAVILKL